MSATQPGPLIGPGALARLLARPDQPGLPGPPARPVVLDVRWRLAGPPGIDSYRAGHIPGAVFVDLESDLARVSGAAAGRLGAGHVPASGTRHW
jgi:thiosulfate/3-mercaptopyruvate sulfurtransferase